MTKRLVAGAEMPESGWGCGCLSYRKSKIYFLFFQTKAEGKGLIEQVAGRDTEPRWTLGGGCSVMRLAVIFSGALLGLLAAQGTGNECPHKKSATLLPSFTVTPTATESTGTSTATESIGTSTATESTGTSTATESTGTPTATESTGTPTATESTASPETTRHGSTTQRTTTAGTPSHKSTTATHNPATATSHTVHPTSNSTATSPESSTGSPHPGPPPPTPSPSPCSKEVKGDYTWMNGSQPCVHLQAQIQIRVLYPTQGGGKAWGISVVNPNKTKVQGGCEGAHAHLLLSFPYGQLSFGFKQEPLKSTVYLNYMAIEHNVSFPGAVQWTFSVQNSSLRELQTPLGQSYSCRNASIILSPAFHLDLLSLKLQAAQLPPTGAFGPNFFCPSDKSNMRPLIISLILIGIIISMFVTFPFIRRRRRIYQLL
uniref:Macrosialin n=1 Tax=Sus scrofa TaxID=9823 RepID=A0A8D1KDL6_PIG